MTKTPEVLLLHIIDAINQIETYVDNQDFKAFEADRKTQDAIIRQLEIVGEVSSKLETNFKQNHPHTPGEKFQTFEISLFMNTGMST